MHTAVVTGPRAGGWLVDVPETRAERARGLLGARVPALAAGTGMLFERARSIHTVGMRIPILAAFLDRDRRVVTLRLLPPGRVVLPRPRVQAVLELPPGADVRAGDILEVGRQDDVDRRRSSASASADAASTTRGGGGRGSP